MADVTVPPWSKPFPSDISAEVTVIKEGTVIESLKFYTGKPYFLFGRLDSSDSILEHPSISRRHAVIFYGNGDIHNGSDSFWIGDLGSTHGTTVNRERIQPGSFKNLKNGISFSFGTSTRIYVFEDNSEISDCASQEVEQILSPAARTLVISNEDTLSPTDPAQIHQMVKKYFDYQDIEFEPRFNGFDNNLLRYTFTAILKIDGVEDVDDTVLKGSGETQEDALNACYVKAYDILLKYNLLNPLFFESLEERQKRELVENDYYLSDEDTFFDRTGDIEQKRLRRINKNANIHEDDFKSRNFSIKSKKINETSRIHESKLEALKMELIRTKSLLSREVKRMSEFDFTNCTVDDEADELIKSSDRKSIQKQIVIYEGKISATERNIRREQQAITKCLENERLSVQDVVEKRSEPKEETFNEINNECEAFPEEYENFYLDAPIQKVDFNECIEVIPEEVEHPRLVKKGPQFIPDSAMLQKEAKRKRAQRDNAPNEDEGEYWEPPKEQSGDGTTRLNEKFGY